RGASAGREGLDAGQKPTGELSRRFTRNRVNFTQSSGAARRNRSGPAQPAQPARPAPKPQGRRESLHGAVFASMLSNRSEPEARREASVMYQQILLAYDGSVEGRLALREGAALAMLCGADV